MGPIVARSTWQRAGDLIQDEVGLLKMGFSYYIGSCSFLNAELWGILIGLQLAACQVVIEVESLLAVDLVSRKMLSSCK